MISQSQFQKNISIILVEPQMGENIGATARAMKNFALLDLRLVAPRDGWPNEKAASMSVGAIDLIESAKIFESVQDAIADLEYVYAATAAPRDMNKDYVLSHDLQQDIDQARNIGIMFGRENSGLNNKEISYANKIVTIDTDVNFSSLNIAHSVAVICSQIFKGKNKTRNDLDNIQELATMSEVEHFNNHLISELDKKRFFKGEDKKEQMELKIRNLFGRINHLSKSEVQTLRGIVTVLSKEDKI
jgi:tRNA/rRNA methyltransferase